MDNDKYFQFQSFSRDKMYSPTIADISAIMLLSSREMFARLADQNPTGFFSHNIKLKSKYAMQ